MPITGKRGKPSRRVRLEDLARQCGVSVSTASRALAGGKGVRADGNETSEGFVVRAGSGAVSTEVPACCATGSTVSG